MASRCSSLLKHAHIYVSILWNRVRATGKRQNWACLFSVFSPSCPNSLLHFPDGIASFLTRSSTPLTKMQHKPHQSFRHVLQMAVVTVARFSWPLLYIFRIWSNTILIRHCVLSDNTKVIRHSIRSVATDISVQFFCYYLRLFCFPSVRMASWQPLFH